MGNVFGGLSGGESFLTGLAASTMDAFKQQHDEGLKEDARAKAIDYEIIQDAMKRVNEDDTLTPSQRQAKLHELMERSIDVFKPKGHGGIKENLKQIFGGGERYTPRGTGDVLTKPRPVLDVMTPGVVKGQGPAVFNGGVTLPAPPDMPYRVPQPEKTFHEQEMLDKERIIDANTERQLAVQQARLTAQQQQNLQKNRDMLERIGVRDHNTATIKMRQMAAMYGDPNDPNNQELARQAYAAELTEKKQMQQSRLALNAERIKSIDARISEAETRLKQGWARLAQGSQRLAQSREKSFNSDPQIKGSWDKVKEYIGSAKTARTQASILRGRFAQEGDDKLIENAEALEEKADEFERKGQDIMEAIQGRQDQLMGMGVTLPGPPTGGRTLESVIQGFVNSPKNTTHRQPTPEELAKLKAHYGLQ